MNIIRLIEAGVLVTPATNKRLTISEDNSWLIAGDGSEKYPFYRGKVPILLLDREWADQYVRASAGMCEEYNEDSLAIQNGMLARLKKKILDPPLTAASLKAFSEVFDNQGEDAVCLSVGGGPGKPHKKLTNLNIGPFPNVDIVADAHCLPYACESVDAIFCGAVLEHLSDPVKAVNEMRRVLKKGGQVFSDTPFLQKYHGYPHHYQNFTLTGHRHLFENNGYSILDCGVSVGPLYTFFDLSMMGINNYFPMLFRKPGKILLALLASIVLPFDKIATNSKNAYVLASGTYVAAQKL